MRIGHGFDVHRLVEKRALILCGENIPYEKGLLGHSDADVALHALMDAILGALALGDIGKLFPDNDPTFKDADSMKLLAQVIAKAEDCGYLLSNADITIIAQQPKLSPYIQNMRQNIAATCKVDNSAINVKATTEEHLGYTGKGEGIAAHAVCIMKHK